MSRPEMPPPGDAPPPLASPELVLQPVSVSRAIEAREIATKGRSLRQHTARGTTINGAFLIGLSSLGLLKGYVVAAFLTRADFGIWGILVVGLGTLGWLKGASVSDKYVQQSEADQQLAFQRAFTLELIFTGALMLVCVVAIPLLVLLYGTARIAAPAAVVVALYVPTVALQSPRWVLYRRMDFVRQRSLEAVEPVVAVVATVALAVAGAGYWSLVIGTVIGGLCGSAVTVAAAPYPLALRYERGTAREYLSFSWPLMLTGLAGIAIAQASLLVPNLVIGLGAVGAVTLASTISLYAQQLDQIVTDTMYPAVCAVRERIDLLFETFVKSNRLALMWGLPFGVGVALFASDLVHDVLGPRWISAIGLIQVFGLVAAADQIGFNWSAFYRALGRTRPILVSTILTATAFVASVVPLTLWKGLTGFGWSMAIMTIALLGSRAFYLRRLFADFSIARHVARAVLPTIPAVLLVFALRGAEPAHTGAVAAGVEFAAYVSATIAATLVFEHRLLAEVRGYLRRPPRREEPGVPAAV